MSPVQFNDTNVEIPIPSVVGRVRVGLSGRHLLSESYVKALIWTMGPVQIWLPSAYQYVGEFIINRYIW